MYLLVSNYAHLAVPLYDAWRLWLLLTAGGYSRLRWSFALQRSRRFISQLILGNQALRNHIPLPQQLQLTRRTVRTICQFPLHKRTLCLFAAGRHPTQKIQLERQIHTIPNVSNMKLFNLTILVSYLQLLTNQ